MPRVYVPYPEKHKRPKGFGSLCPHMSPHEPQRLLDLAISLPGVAQNALWIANGRWIFQLHPTTGGGPDAWHGFPIIGGDADERVLSALVSSGRITKHDAKQIRGQRELPEEYP
ncbi:MAG: hypothetical protein HY791_17600 [Deltaproteobacteria bacterium]|nr:hypothetical protein [Deltaproteobacteria bacterium]